MCKISIVNNLLASEISIESKAELNKLIEKYILENPEIILKAWKLIEAKQKNEQELKEKKLIQQFEEIIFSQKGIFYDPKVQPVIVSFVDFNCSFCKKSDEVISAVIKKYPDIIYLVKNYPILGEGSVIAARAAIFLQFNESSQTYLSFINLMMKSSSRLTLEKINTFARSSGSPLNITLEKLQSSDINDKLEENFRLSEMLGISGTPTLLINNKIYRGHIEGDNLDEIINTYIGDISKPQN